MPNRPARPLAFLVAALPLAGCLNPSTTSVSTFAPEPLEQSRANLAVHDPFPRADLGPGESLRPPDFAVPRDTPRGVRERTYGAQLREEFGRDRAIVP